MAPVKLKPLPARDKDAGYMGGYRDAGGHTGDLHIPTTESVASHPETDVHATAHMSHISWGRAGPAISIKNGAAAGDECDLVVVGSKSLLYHPEDVKEAERHIFCTVYENVGRGPVEIARTPWSRLTEPHWSHPVKFQNFARTISKNLIVMVWSIHHDESSPDKTTSLVVGYGTIQSSLLAASIPQLAWIPLKMPPSGFKVKRPVVVDLHVGFVGGKFKGADGQQLPESVSDRLGPLDEMGNPSNPISSCPSSVDAVPTPSGHSGGVEGRRQSHSHAHNLTEEAEDRTSLMLAFYGVLLILAYFGVVCAFYIPVEGWTIRECLYFAVVTFTTVGYGDYTPTGDGSKLFTCIVALLGVSFIAVGVGVIGQEVVRVQQKIIEKGREAASHAVHSQFTEETDEDGKQAISHINEHLVKTHPNPLLIVFWAFVPVVTVIGIHAAVIGHVEGWTLVDAIYISTITGTSVGYGELYPKKEFSQWFSVFSIPVMVFCISYALGKVARIPVQHEMSKLHQKLLTIEITEEDFDLMGNGDGDIDRTEFIVHMLKAMKKVDDSLIDKLMDRFNKLDADGSGYISKDELKSVWQAKQAKTEGTAEGEAWSRLRKASVSEAPQATSVLTGSGKVKPVLQDIAEVVRTKSLIEKQASKHADHDSKWRDASNHSHHRKAKSRSFENAPQYTPMGSFAGH